METKTKIIFGIIIGFAFSMILCFTFFLKLQTETSRAEATAIQATLTIARATATTLATQMVTSTSTPQPMATATRTPYPTPTSTPEIHWETIEPVVTAQFNAHVVEQGNWVPLWGNEKVDYTGTFSASAQINSLVDSYIWMDGNKILLQVANAHQLPLIRTNETYQYRQHQINSKIDTFLKNARTNSFNQASKMLDAENLAQKTEVYVQQQLIQLFKKLGFNDIRIEFSERENNYILQLNEMGKRTVEYSNNQFTTNKCGNNTPKSISELGLEFTQMVYRVQNSDSFDASATSLINVAQPFTVDLDFLRKELETRYDVENGTVTKIKVPVQMGGKDNTMTTYTAHWLATQYYGYIIIFYEGHRQSIPYMVQKDVSLEIETVERACNSE